MGFYFCKGISLHQNITKKQVLTLLNTRIMIRHQILAQDIFGSNEFFNIYLKVKMFSEGTLYFQ